MEIKYTFSDWIEGRINVRWSEIDNSLEIIDGQEIHYSPLNSNLISQDDYNKIKNCQESVFDKYINAAVNDWENIFIKRYEESLSPEYLLENEISDVQKILENNEIASSLIEGEKNCTISGKEYKEIESSNFSYDSMRSSSAFSGNRWAVNSANLKYYQFLKTFNKHNDTNIPTFQTHLPPDQLEELCKQLINNGFIHPRTYEENFLHVFGKSSTNGLNFKPVKWIKLNRYREPHKSALLELLTLVIGKTPNQKIFNYLITDIKSNAIILGKLNKTKPSNYLGDFEKWTGCKLPTKKQ